MSVFENFYNWKGNNTRAFMLVFIKNKKNVRYTKNSILFILLLLPFLLNIVSFVYWVWKFEYKLISK